MPTQPSFRVLPLSRPSRWNWAPSTRACCAIENNLPTSGAPSRCRP